MAKASSFEPSKMYVLRLSMAMIVIATRRRSGCPSQGGRFPQRPHIEETCSRITHIHVSAANADSRNVHAHAHTANNIIVRCKADTYVVVVVYASWLDRLEKWRVYYVGRWDEINRRKRAIGTTFKKYQEIPWRVDTMLFSTLWRLQAQNGVTWQPIRLSFYLINNFTVYRAL